MPLGTLSVAIAWLRHSDIGIATHILQTGAQLQLPPLNVVKNRSLAITKAKIKAERQVTDYFMVLPPLIILIRELH